MNPRLIAARIINDVTDGRSLTDALNAILPSVPDARDRSFIQAICYGVCRYYSNLDVIVSYLLQNPMREKDSDVHALLLVGLYQLMYMRVPAHAAVDETVNATAKLKKPWARGFVNAILREYLRQADVLAKEAKDDPEVMYSHPHWWIETIKKAWPDHWQAILQANNEHPPMWVREKGNDKPILIDPPVAVEDIPGFLTGTVTVQDAAAQLAAGLMELAPHQRVLDACAAPGGKLTHILELEPHLDACIAVEKDRQRITSIKENLSRLKLHADCICADVGDVKKWWDGKLFDRILLDAPCSASGVIRRHPDIKLLRAPNDMRALAKLQRQLLEALWPLLKPGGLLVYATCSIFPEENSHLIQSFLQAHPDAQENPISAPWGIPMPAGRQILPGMDNMDGFYYAKVNKLVK